MKNVNILNDLNTLNKLHTSTVESHITNNGIADFTCDNAGYIDNIVIEGKTLVNLNTFTAKGYDGNRIWLYDTNYSLCTNNTQYTILNTSDKLISIQYVLNGNWVDGHFVYLQPNTSQLVTVSNNHQFGGIFGGISHGWSNSDNSYNELKQSIIILEGDHTDKPITYFEGLKSVGQGDKIEALTTPIHNNLIPQNYTKGEGYWNSMVDVGSVVSDSNWYRMLEYIPVKPNTQYTGLCTGTQVVYYDENKNVIYHNQSDLVLGYEYYIFTTPQNAKYIRVSYPKNREDNICIFEGIKHDKKQILTTLRSLPNGVKDTIEKRGNKYVKVQRCGEYTFTGYENISFISDTNGLVQANIDVNFVIKSYDDNLSKNVVSNMLPSLGNISNKETIFKHPTVNNCIVVRISNSKITADKTICLNYIKDKLTIVYELEAPIITELPNFNLQTHKGDNTLWVNSGAIQCDASFDVCEGIRNELDEVKDKVSSIHDTVVEGIREIRHYPKLQNGWVTNSADYTPTFVKFGNLVTFNMRIKGGKWSSATIIVDNLPEEFRVKPGNAQVFPAIDLATDKTYNAIIYKEGHIKLYGVDAEPTGGLAIMGTYYVN